MKEFFYLDMDLLQSYISQIFKGLLINTTDTKTHNESKVYEGPKESTEFYLSGNLGTSGNVDIKIAKGALKSALDGGVKYTTTGRVKNEEYTDEIQSVLQKVMKDDLFDRFEKYLYKENLICDNVEDFIDYVDRKPQLYFKMKANFNYINLNRINDMFQEKYSNIYRTQCKDDQYPNSDYFSSVRDNITLLRKMLPYRTFLCHNDYLVLINEKKLRVNKNVAGFKFNPNATILGRIRKTTLESPSANQPPKVIDALNKIQSSTFNILYEQGFISIQPKYIIDPIAVYYE